MEKIMNECLRQKIGSCGGCDVLAIAINQARWRGIEPARVESQYCPPGERMDFEWAINRDASHGMGQRRGENMEGLTDIRPTNSSSGAKISKSKTGQWFQE